MVRHHQDRPHHRPDSRLSDVASFLAFCLLWLVLGPALLFAEHLDSEPLWWIAGLAALGMIGIVLAGSG